MRYSLITLSVIYIKIYFKDICHNYTLVRPKITKSGLIRLKIN